MPHFLRSSVLLSLALIAGMTACGTDKPSSAPFEKLNTPAELAAQNQEFPKGIEPVVDGVWVAIGYGLANSILIEGDDGLIVIDTMETMEEARIVAREFRKLSSKPLKALIYTHNHADHVLGAQAFVEELADEAIPVEVFAHETTEYYVNRVASEYRPIITARSFRMFGSHLDEAGFVNNGLGPRLALDENSSFGFVKPTRTLSDELEVRIAGVDFKLVHAPGETNDQIFVWLPKLKLLAVGDNLYKAFPNLYTIRGTPYRSLKQWAASIDKMRALPVAHIVPSHTRPLHGEQAIQQVLTNYRDAIRFVHDQTVRWINAGLTPDEIVEKIRLPEHLAAEPYLQEFYGTVEFSTRAVFSGNLGWFDGNPSQLRPLAPQAEAEKMAALAGGESKLNQQLQAAIEDRQYQWALQLSDWVLRLSPDDEAALTARVEALTGLGEVESNPNARHYYLMSALELRDGTRLRPVSKGSEAMLRALPTPVLMDALAANLRAEEVLDVERRVGLTFTDTGETWTIWIRRGVAEMQPRLLDDLDIHVRMDSLTWKQLLGKQINPAVALARMDFETGGRIALTRFLLLFKPSREAPEPAPFAALAGE